MVGLLSLLAGVSENNKQMVGINTIRHLDLINAVLLFLVQIACDSMKGMRRIDSSGNVGIGTTSPSKPLHIYSASDTAIRLQNSTTGTGTTDGFLLEQSGSDSLIVNYEAGNLRFSTSNSERMRIDSSGNFWWVRQQALTVDVDWCS